MPQKMQKLSVELPAYLVTQVKWWSERFGMTGSEALSYFARLGMDTYNQHDTIRYLSYRAGQIGKVQKKGGVNETTV